MRMGIGLDLHSPALTGVDRVAALFASLGVQGAYYDASDRSTLFQDAAGTMPVTAVGQPVGLMKDKSSNGNDASQGTTANEPTLASVNGYIAAQGDLTDDVMSVSLPANTSKWMLAYASPYGFTRSVTQRFSGSTNLPLGNLTKFVALEAPSASDSDTVAGALSGFGPEYTFIGRSPNTSIFLKNHSHTARLVGANGATYDWSVPSGGATLDVTTVGLTAPVTVLIDLAVKNDTSLTGFNCNSNQLTGSIPDLSANTSLTGFVCSTNQLTGSIPDLSANTSLTGFVCSTNQLTGSIPDLSANTSLANFYCNSNQLTGSIPNLSANTSLANFVCSTNQLTGSIPDLSANTSLANFYCYSNQLTGSIPDLSANTSLANFYCNTNQLTDYVGTSIAPSCTNFEAQNNALTQSAVDAILEQLDSAGASNGTCYLQGGTNATPSAAGQTAVTNLQGKGWTVSTN